MNRDVALGAILLVIAAGYYRLAEAIPESQLADAVGPAGLPVAYAAVLAVLSLTLLARGLRAAPPVSDGAPQVSRKILLRVLGMLALGIGYIVAAPWLGYALALAVLIVGTSYYQGGRLDRRVLLVGACGAVVLWVLFVVLLGVRQPEGILGLERWLGSS